MRARADRDERFNAVELLLDAEPELPIVHPKFGNARARRAIARKVREWRAAVREGRALRVERHRGRDDLPAAFLVDWDGRIESVRLTTWTGQANEGRRITRQRLADGSVRLRYFWGSVECDPFGTPLPAAVQEPPR